MPGQKKVSQQKDDPSILQDIKIWKETGSQAAMLRLIDAHESRIRRMARKRAHDSDLCQDLISVGRMALYNAIDRYTPKPGIPFFAYATRFIRKAMHDELNLINNIVDIPKHKVREAKAGKLDEMEVELINEARHTADIDDIYDTASCAALVSTDTTLIEKQNRQGMRSELEKAMECLTPGESLLIKRRLNGDNPENEPIENLDMASPRMRKMEKRALMRLKTTLLRQGFTPQFLQSEF